MIDRVPVFSAHQIKWRGLDKQTKKDVNKLIMQTVAIIF